MNQFFKLFIWEQTATCATYSLNWLVFITEMKSVYSAVRTGSLNKSLRFVFKGWIESNLFQPKFNAGTNINRKSPHCRNHYVMRTLQNSQGAKIIWFATTSQVATDTVPQHISCLLTLYNPVVTMRTAKFNFQEFHVLPTQCIYVFCVDLRTNSDYFPIQH
jgi:hypothetical protein